MPTAEHRWRSRDSHVTTGTCYNCCRAACVSTAGPPASSASSAAKNLGLFRLKLGVSRPALSVSRERFRFKDASRIFPWREARTEGPKAESGWSFIYLFIYLFKTKGWPESATDMPMTVNSKLTHYKIRQIRTENKDSKTDKLLKWCSSAGRWFNGLTTLSAKIPLRTSTRQWLGRSLYA